jgi:hypothetical protein
VSKVAMAIVGKSRKKKSTEQQPFLVLCTLLLWWWFCSIFWRWFHNNNPGGRTLVTNYFGSAHTTLLLHNIRTHTRAICVDDFLFFGEKNHRLLFPDRSDTSSNSTIGNEKKERRKQMLYNTTDTHKRRLPMCVCVASWWNCPSMIRSQKGGNLAQADIYSPKCRECF